MKNPTNGQFLPLDDLVIAEREKVLMNAGFDSEMIKRMEQKLAKKGERLPPVDQLRSHIDYLIKELELPLKVIGKNPGILRLGIELNLKPTVRYVIEELGLPKTVFEKYAGIFSHSIGNLQQKVGYVSTKGDAKIIFADFPLLFSYSLENRIKPRVEFAESKGANWKIRTCVTPGDEEFCRDLKCSLEEYNAFKSGRYAA